MQWINGMKMFPYGRTPVQNITLEQLENDNIEEINMYLLKMARQMIIYQELVSWKADGTRSNKYTYNIFPDDLPDNVSCLSAYGQKMVNDWYSRNKYHGDKGVKQTDVGFNYTGI